MANIIIKDKTSFGKTRSEQEENMRKEWGSTMTDEQLDKLKYLERKNREATGSDTSFYRGNDIDQVK
jgi:hypothetical protein